MTGTFTPDDDILMNTVKFHIYMDDLSSPRRAYLFIDCLIGHAEETILSESNFIYFFGPALLTISRLKPRLQELPSITHFHLTFRFPSSAHFTSYSAFRAACGALYTPPPQWYAASIIYFDLLITSLLAPRYQHYRFHGCIESSTAEKRFCSQRLFVYHCAFQAAKSASMPTMISHSASCRYRRAAFQQSCSVNNAP